MQSEGRNTRIHILTRFFPHVSTPKLFPKGVKIGRDGGQKKSSGRWQGDGVGSEFECLCESIGSGSNSAQLPLQWKTGAAMAMTWGQGGQNRPVMNTVIWDWRFKRVHKPRAILWCDWSERLRGSLHWIGEVERQGCGLSFEKKKKN